MSQTIPHAEQLVREWVNVWNDGAYEKIPAVLAESATIYDPSAPEGKVHGHDEFESFLRELRTGFPDFRITIDDMLAGDEVVMIEWTVTGTHEGAFNDIPPTERELEHTGMSKILIADGKVQEDRIYYDFQEVIEQLGLIDDQE
jgi:steroid delta-isomerase-like uncharacterized protein